jgi:hypothetical protein
VTNILLLFVEVKETFFPDWNPANLWGVQLKSQLSDWYLGNAYVNRTTKTIEIDELFAPQDDDVMRCLLLHQLCHVIGGDEHGRKWAASVLQVAKTADLRGQKSLADLIWADAGASWDTKEPNINPILQNMQAALAERPDETAVNIIDAAARAMGVSGLDLLIRHPLVETYFYSLKQALAEKGQSAAGWQDNKCSR